MSAVQRAPQGKNGAVWSSGLCDCASDCGSCCLGCWCPCVLYGHNVEKLTGQDCYCPCLTFYALAALAGCVCCISGPTREQLRAKYQLEAAPCGDVCLHFCCVYCAICQEARELKYRESASAPTGAYTAPHAQTMTAPPSQQYPAQPGYPNAQSGYPTAQQGYPAAQKY